MSDTEGSSVPKPAETVHQMKSRHQKDLKDLKKTHKGKALKERESSLAEEQAAELAALQTAWTVFRAAEEGVPLPAAVPAPVADADADPEAPPAASSLYAERQAAPMTAKQRKRLAREAREAAEDAAVAAAAAIAPDRKKIEEESLARRLKADVRFPSPFAEAPARVKEIRGDGHCMFRSVADQLTLWELSGADEGAPAAPVAEPEGGWTASALRVAAVNYMREHKDDFFPFLGTPEGDPLPDMAAAERYFDAMAVTGESGGDIQWGGQPELTALAAVLGRPIIVHQATSAPHTEHAPEGCKGRVPLHVALLHHSHALGCHYNSVVPVLKDA